MTFGRLPTIYCTEIFRIIFYSITIHKHRKFFIQGEAIAIIGLDTGAIETVYAIAYRLKFF